MRNAASVFDPLSGPTEIRRRATIAEATWWAKNAVRHVRFVSCDASAGVDDRADAVRAAEEAIDKLAALL